MARRRLQYSYADTVQYNSDGMDTGNSKNSKFTLCTGTGSFVDIFATINHSGSGKGAQHFANNGMVTITTSVPTAAADFLAAAGGSVQTLNWDNTSHTVASAAMRLSVATDWVAGNYPVTYTATGVDQNNQPYVLTDANNVEISAATTGCATGGGGETGTPPAPAYTAPTVEVLNIEDGATYEINTVPVAACSVSDAEDTDEAATPVVSSVSGPLAAYGLGMVTVSCSYMTRAPRCWVPRTPGPTPSSTPARRCSATRA